MNIEVFRNYCLSKVEVSECFPFDETTLVFKVMGKMFAITDTEDEFAIALKCDPELVNQLRERYPCVKPGYHLNKKYWNTVTVDGSINDAQLMEWIDHSYNEVVKTLPKKQQALLAALMART
jgi:predicted DNA-binding protein (MmcQ/YjbR family)